jgi:DNA helicase-2/ATP-dependent DNA helicase PcrA
MDITAPQHRFERLAAQIRRDLHVLGAAPLSRARASLVAAARDGADEGPAAEICAAAVLKGLTLCGDIGTGRSYGEKMLVKKREAAILLHGDFCVLLGGDPDKGEPHGLLRSLDAAPSNAVNILEATGALSDGERAELAMILSAGSWGREAIPSDRVMFVLVLAGLVPGMSVPLDVADWLSGLYPTAAQSGEASAPDLSQDAVIRAPADRRQVVTAGPGSGKTHTATQRVIHLVGEGVAPSRIQLITFTRIASQEVGGRISEALANVSYGGGVRCGTVDSLAWGLATSVGDAPGGGHDQTIKKARRLLSEGDPVIEDQLAGLSHLIIDEAQDIVGDRRDLCRALIDALPPTAGVTILGDGAQAIYGAWAGERAAQGSLHKAMEKAPGWRTAALGTNHRTRSPSLKSFFAEARGLLEGGDDPRGVYLELRGMLEDVATDPSVSLFGPAVPWRDDTLILFRGRAAAEAASARLTQAGRVHRLKLSGLTLVRDPIIGALCAGLAPGASLRPDHVERRLKDLHPPYVEHSAEEIIASLGSLGDGSRGFPKVSALAEGTDREPVEWTTDHIGRAGPLLGSIHGAKGREAADVVLMLPPVPSDEDVDWLEEARVLFVGATRASRRLYLGRSHATRILPGRSGSRWLKGSSGGLLLSGHDGLRPLAGSGPALSVWTAAHAHLPCTFRRATEQEGAGWQLVSERGEQLAEVTENLAGSLDFLGGDTGNIATGTLRIVGATTVVERREGGAATAVTLLPVLLGVARSGAKKVENDD